MIINPELTELTASISQTVSELQKNLLKLTSNYHNNLRKFPMNDLHRK